LIPGLSGSKKGAQSEIDALKKQIAELQAKLDKLSGD